MAETARCPFTWLVMRFGSSSLESLLARDERRDANAPPGSSAFFRNP